MIVCKKANAVFEKYIAVMKKFLADEMGRRFQQATQIYLAKLDNFVIDLIGELLQKNIKLLKISMFFKGILITYGAVYQFVIFNNQFNPDYLAL